MKPYYDYAGITIYLGDCREILPSLEKVDLCLTDPPYGMTACSWDEKLGGAGTWAILRGTADCFIITACNPYAAQLISANESAYKHEWIWYKDKPSNFTNAKLCPMREHEIVLVFGKPIYTPQMETRRGSGPERVGSKARSFGSEHLPIGEGVYSLVTDKRYPSSVRQINTARSSLLGHPTQKPIELFSYILRSYQCETILDPFMGVGTSLRAAKDMGRKAIGIEISERYAEIAAKRMSQEVLNFG